jgi:hypothetical protein
MRVLATLALAVVLSAAGAVPARACPGCKDALALPQEPAPPPADPGSDPGAGSDPADPNPADAYSTSIVFMFAMPFVLIGGLAAMMALSSRPSLRRAPTDPTPTAAPSAK